MNKRLNRILSILLTLGMILSSTPVPAFADPGEPTLTVSELHITNNYQGSLTHANGSPSVWMKWETTDFPESDQYLAYIDISPTTLDVLGDRVVSESPAGYWHLVDNENDHGVITASGGEVSGCLNWYPMNPSEPILNYEDEVVVQITLYAGSTVNVNASTQPILTKTFEWTVDWNVQDPYMTADTYLEADWAWGNYLGLEPYGDPTNTSSGSFWYETGLYVWPDWSGMADRYDEDACWTATLEFNADGRSDGSQAFIDKRGGYHADTMNWAGGSEGRPEPTLSEGSRVMLGMEVVQKQRVYDIDSQQYYVQSDVIKRMPPIPFEISAGGAQPQPGGDDDEGEHADAKPVINDVSYDVSTHTLTVDFTTEDTATRYFEVYMITADEPDYSSDDPDFSPWTITKSGVSGDWYVLAFDSMDYGQDGVTFNRSTGKGRLVTSLYLPTGIEDYPAIGDVVYVVMQTEGLPVSGDEYGQGTEYSSNAYVKIPLPDPENVYVSVGTYQEDEREFDVNAGADPFNPDLQTFTGGKWVVAVVRMTKDENLIYHVAPFKEDLMKVASGTSGYATYAKDPYDRDCWQWCDYQGNVLDSDNPWTGYNAESIDPSMGTIPVSVYQFQGEAASGADEMLGFYDGEDLIVGIQAISKEDPTVYSNLVTVRIPLEEASLSQTFRPSDLNEPEEPTEPETPEEPVQPTLGYYERTINTAEIQDISLSKDDGTYTFDSLLCGETVLTKNTDYTATRGAVKIKASYLETLEAGEYTFTFHYTGTAGEDNTPPTDPELALTIVQMCSPVLTVTGYDGDDITDSCTVVWRTKANNRVVSQPVVVAEGTELTYTVTPGDPLMIDGVQYYKTFEGEVTLTEANQPVEAALEQQGRITVIPKVGGEPLESGFTVAWYDADSNSKIGTGASSPIKDAGTRLKYEITMTGSNADDYNDVPKASAPAVVFGNTDVDANISRKTSASLNVTGIDGITEKDYAVLWYSYDAESKSFRACGSGTELKNINGLTEVYYEIVPLDYGNTHNWLRFYPVPVSAATRVSLTEGIRNEAQAELTAVRQVNLTVTVTNADGFDLKVGASQTPWDGYSVQPSTWYYSQLFANYTFTRTGNTWTATVYDFDTTVRVAELNQYGYEGGGNYDTTYKFLKSNGGDMSATFAMNPAALPEMVYLNIDRMTPDFAQEWHYDAEVGDEVYGGFPVVREENACYYEEAVSFEFSLFNATQNRAVPDTDYTVVYSGAGQALNFNGEAIAASGSVKIGDKLRLTMTVPEDKREGIHADLTGPFTSEITLKKYWSREDYQNDTYRFNFSYNAWGKVNLKTQSNGYYTETYGIYDTGGDLIASGTKSSWWNEASVELAPGTYTLAIWKAVKWLNAAPTTLEELENLLSASEFQKRSFTIANGQCTVPSPRLGTCPDIAERVLFTEDSGFLDEMITASNGEKKQIRLAYTVDDSIVQSNPDGMYAIKVILSSKYPPVILQKEADHDWKDGGQNIYDKYINLFVDGVLDEDNTVHIDYYTYNGLSEWPTGFTLYTDKPSGVIYFTVICDYELTGSDSGSYTFSAEGWLMDERAAEDSYYSRKSNSKASGTIGSVILQKAPAANCNIYFASDYLRMPDNGPGNRSDYENGMWIYTLPNKTVNLYMDDVLIYTDTSSANGMAFFSLKMDDAFKVKFNGDPGWTLSGSHKLHAETVQEDGSTIKSQTYVRECLTKDSDIHPAVLTDLWVECYNDNRTTGERVLLKNLGYTNNNWRNRNGVFISYGTLYDGIPITYEFTATVEDADCVDGDLYIWLTAQLLDVYRIPLTRVEGTNQYKGSMTADQWVWSSWEVTISSVKPAETGEAVSSATLTALGTDAAGVSAMDLIEDAIGTAGTIPNPFTGEDQTLDEYDVWVDQTFFGDLHTEAEYEAADDDTKKAYVAEDYEKLSSMILEGAASQMEDTESFFQTMAEIFPGMQLPDDMVFDGSMESVQKLRSAMGINVYYPLAVQEDDDSKTMDAKTQILQYLEMTDEEQLQYGTIATALDGTRVHRFQRVMIETSQADNKPHLYSIYISIYTDSPLFADWAEVDVIDGGVSELTDLCDTGADLFTYMANLTADDFTGGSNLQASTRKSGDLVLMYRPGETPGNWEAKIQSFTEIAVFTEATVQKVEQLNAALQQSNRDMNGGNNTYVQNLYWNQMKQAKQQLGISSDAGSQEGSALTNLAVNIQDKIDQGRKTGTLNEKQIAELTEMKKKVNEINGALSLNIAYEAGKSEVAIYEEIQQTVDLVKNAGKALQEADMGDLMHGLDPLKDFVKDTAKDYAVDEAKGTLYERIDENGKEAISNALKNNIYHKITDYCTKKFDEATGLHTNEFLHETTEMAAEGLKEATKAVIDPSTFIKEKADQWTKEKFEQYARDLDNIVETLNTKYGMDKVRVRGSKTTSRNTNFGRAQNHHDPEGIVYEAVLSNPVEGATVTLWERAADGTETEWDAFEYAQLNPQVTEVDGHYHWDVPEGEWQVRVTAPADRTDLSDNTSADHKNANKDDGSTPGWLPVLPVQLGINIPLVSTADPSVSGSAITADYIETGFTMYMDTETLTEETVTLSDGTNEIAVTISFPDQDTDPQDDSKTYAKTMRLTPVSGSLQPGKTYTVNVTADATGYNGKALTAAYTSEGLKLDEEPAGPGGDDDDEPGGSGSGTTTATTGAAIEPTGAAIENPFNDVEEGDYFYDAVMWALENGITDGTSPETFSPYAPSTRAQMVTFIWRAAGCPEPTITSVPFTDIIVDSYYYKAVLWAYETGITDGTSATSFSPLKEVTRAQSVTFLYRALGSKVTEDIPFTDVKDEAYYYDAVAWAFDNGITDGTSATKFSPEKDCLRAQIVTFLYRAYHGE